MRHALTLWQPYASLCVTPDPEGPSRPVKPVENRSWPVPKTMWRERVRPQWPNQDLVDYQSPFPFRLWIHAAAKDPDSHEWPQVVYDAIPHGDGWPTSVLLGSVLVTGCHHAEECWELRGSEHGDLVGPAPDGWHCSPWAEPDAYHWTLADPQPLAEPIPMKGRQGLWRLPDDVAVPA